MSRKSSDGALDHPLELRLGGLEIAAVEMEARRYQRPIEAYSVRG